MKYQNKQTGVVAELVEMNDKSKMVILQGEKPISCTISTFKRWWKKVEEQVQEEKLVPMPGAEKLAELKAEVDEDTCADGRKYSDIGKEIAEQAKQKAKSVKVKKEKEVKPAKKSSVNIDEQQEQIIDFLAHNDYEVKCCPGHVLKATSKNKRNLYLYLGGKKFVLYLSKNNVPEGKTADRVANCPLSHRFDIQYNEIKTLKEFM